MQIVHLSTSDTLGGGSIAAHAIHRGLLQRGIASRMVVRVKGTQDATVSTLPNGPVTIAAKSRRILSRIATSMRPADGDTRERRPYSYLSGTSSDYRFAPDHLLPADLIQINWVSDFLDWRSFFRTRPRVPLVWRLSDMSPFTGLCHYSNGCDRFTSNCHDCPQALSAKVADISESSFRMKQQSFAKLEPHDLTIVCQSDWMAGLVAQSPLLARFPRHVIRNGVNRDEFFPIDKPTARQALNLDRDVPLVLLYGFSPEPRKGFDDLIRAIKRKNLDKKHFLVLGPKPWSRISDEGWQTIESVHDRRLLRLIYSACDLMAFPSIEDNCPNAVVEAIACGTPVLAFDGSGADEIIAMTKAGFTLPCRDFDQFARELHNLTNSPSTLKMLQGRCSPGIADGFGFDAMLDSYIQIYQRILDRAA